MVDLIESRVLRQIVSYCFGQNAPMQLERQNNNNRVEDTPDDTTRVAFSSEKNPTLCVNTSGHPTHPENFILF